MTSRVLAAALALGFGLSSVAQAQPILTAPIAARDAGQGGTVPSAWVEPPRAAAPTKPEAGTASPSNRNALASSTPDPRASDPEPVEPMPSAERRSPRTVEPAPAPEARASVAPAPRRPSQVRAARFAGGDGAAWKTGRNAYAFSGQFGGCRISGHAGPRGFTIGRSC